MGKHLVRNIIGSTATMINDGVYNARNLYNDTKLNYAQKMSAYATENGTASWQNPNTASYLYRNGDGQTGPLAEFNDTYKGERYRFWETDKKMNAYKQEYNNFENEAINKGYTAYTKDGNEAFKFSKKTRKLSQEAGIAFDRDLLEIRDRKGNIVDCPHAPEECYDPAYRMYNQKRTMAKIADDIVNNHTPNAEYSKIMHKHYKDGLEMMENGIDPQIEELNSHGYKFDSKFDRSRCSYQKQLEREQPFIDPNNRVWDNKNIIDADFREIFSKDTADMDNDKRMADLLQGINALSNGKTLQFGEGQTKTGEKSLHDEDKTSENFSKSEDDVLNKKDGDDNKAQKPDSRSEVLAEALYWVASFIQDPQKTFDKFIDKYGDTIKAAIDKHNGNSQQINENLNRPDASPLVKSVNTELNRTKTEETPDYDSVNAYFEAQNEHIKNYNELFKENDGITFKDEKGKTIQVDINDSAQKMSVINCADAGKVKIFDKDGSELDKISDRFTESKEQFDKIAPTAERMAHNVDKHDMESLVSCPEDRKQIYEVMGVDYDKRLESYKSIVPYRKKVVNAYEKGDNPLKVSMQVLNIGELENPDVPVSEDNKVHNNEQKTSKNDNKGHTASSTHDTEQYNSERTSQAVKNAMDIAAQINGQESGPQFEDDDEFGSKYNI